MRAFQTEDGYTFYLQADGTLTDTLNPADADQTYASLEQLQAVTTVQEFTPRCQWFARCTRPGTVAVPHPILGEVLACEKCAKFARS